MNDLEYNKKQDEIYKENRNLEKAIIKYIDVTEHASIVRKELKNNFKDIKFRVVSDRFAGGSSVTVYHIGDISKELEKNIFNFVNRFCGFRSDLTDMRYNVGFEYNGERICGASFCSHNGKYWK